VVGRKGRSWGGRVLEYGHVTRDITRNRSEIGKSSYFPYHNACPLLLLDSVASSEKNHGLRKRIEAPISICEPLLGSNR
jgi:hypothetical protein